MNNFFRLHFQNYFCLWTDAKFCNCIDKLFDCRDIGKQRNRKILAKKENTSEKRRAKASEQIKVYVLLWSNGLSKSSEPTDNTLPLLHRLTQFPFNTFFRRQIRKKSANCLKQRKSGCKSHAITEFLMSVPPICHHQLHMVFCIFQFSLFAFNRCRHKVEDIQAKNEAQVGRPLHWDWDLPHILRSSKVNFRQFSLIAFGHSFPHFFLLHKLMNRFWMNLFAQCNCGLNWSQQYFNLRPEKHFLRERLGNAY